MKSKKVLILGHARCGKDTVACVLSKLSGLVFEYPSSEVALNEAVWPVIGHRYGTKQECFDDRVNHRKEWFDIICAYNSEDPSKLARKTLELNDIYVGIRSSKEYETVRGLFTHTIWVDASLRVPQESEESFNFRPRGNLFFIDNNKDYEHLTDQIKDFIKEFF